MSAPYVVFLAVGCGGGGSPVSGGGGGPYLNMSYTVVDGSDNCVPFIPGSWTEPLQAADTQSVVTTRVETNLGTFLQNWGLDITGISFVWLT